MDLSIPDTTWADPNAAVDVPRANRGAIAIDVGLGDLPPPGSRPLPASPVDRLRPRSIGQLLDAGFEVVKFRTRTIAVLAAVLVLPLYAVPAVVSSRLLDGSARNPLSLFSGNSALVSSTGELTGSYWRLLFYSLLGQFGMMIGRMLLGLALAHLVTSWMVGQDPTIGATLRHVGRRSGVALLAWALVLPVKALSAVLCGLGLIYTLPVFAILAPVVSVERNGPLRSIARTHSMSIRRFGPFLGMWALWLVASAAMTQSIGLLVRLVDWLLGGFSWGWVLTSGLTVAFTTIVATVEVAVWAMAYVDLRVRTEGVDIGFEIAEEFERASA